ncbi:hypothetical protein V6N13_131570 [Hibiscus sabdariffa]
MIHRVGCSHLWKGISSVWESIRDSLVWIVGDGRTIDFWKDAWLGDLGPLVDYASAPDIISSMPRVTVADMVDNTGSWRWREVESLLPSSVLHRLAATMPPTNLQSHDFIGWKWRDNRENAVRSAYDYRTGYSRDAHEEVWKVVAALEVFHVIPDEALSLFQNDVSHLLGVE